MARLAMPEDAHAIAVISVDAWREAYAHILPAELLAGLSYDEREERARIRLGERADTWVVERHGSVVGFAIAGKTRYPEVPTDGELSAIYVHPTAYRQGVGSELVCAAATALRNDDFASMCVFCFRDNARVRSFYESLGAAYYNDSSFELAGVRYADVSYIWRSLDDLIDRLGGTRPTKQDRDDESHANDAPHKGHHLRNPA